MRPHLLGSSAAYIAIMAMFGLTSPAFGQQGPSPTLQRIDLSDLCVTNGSVLRAPGGRLAVDTPSSRAVVQGDAEGAADQIAELRFRYLGPSRDSRPLASGELRRQIGLKLQAEDSCNVIYAVWRIAPDPRVAVSLKRNADLHTHAQCGAHGYINFTSQDRDELPPIRPGEVHTLRAALHKRDLTVTADGKLAWRGFVQSEIALPVGQPGFRTDNARFVFEYFAAVSAPLRATASQAPSRRGPCGLPEGD